MSYIKNTDSLVEGSSQLFFTEQRAQQAVQEDLQALDSAIVAEESRAQAAEAGLDSRLDVIEGSGEGSVAKAEQDAKDYADQKVAALVNSAPAVLDTLKELSDALGGDQNFAVTVANQIGAVDDKVDQEISDRQAAVSAEQNRAQSAESALDGRLDVIEGSGEGSVAKAEQDAKDYADGIVSSEQSSRMSADAALSGRLDVVEGVGEGSIAKAEQDAKDYADGIVSSEQSARQSADSALSGRLDVLEADPTTKSYVDGQVSSLDGRLDSLEADATTKAYVDGIASGLDSRLDSLEADPVTKSYVDGEVSDLQGQITQEISDRQSAVSSEESRALAAEGLLDGRLDVLEADPTTKSYVDGEISDLQGQITQEISDRQSAVSSEQSARQSADNALDARLDILESDPTTKTYVDGEVSDLQGQINQEISNRQSAVSGEQSRAEAAEAALDGRLDSLEADSVTKTYVDGEVSDLQGQITQEISDRQSAVSSEQSRAEAAEGALDGRLDVLEADPVTKSYVDGEVSDLQGQVNTEKGRIDAILSAADADKDSFAEIVSLINSVDASNDSAFAGYVSSNNAALAQEVSDRQAGDSALDGRLDVLEGVGAGSVAKAQQDAEDYADAAVLVEKNRAESAEGALDGRLDILEGADTVAGSVAKALKDAKAYTDSEVASEASARSSADTTLQSNIDGLFASKSTSDLAEGSRLYYTQARFDSAFAAKSTSELAEGTNLYYTQARFDSALAAKSTSNLAEGSNLYHTTARARSAAVVNSSSGSETDQAMSVSAGKAYTDTAKAALDAENLTMFKKDGSRAMTGAITGVPGTPSVPSINFGFSNTGILGGGATASASQINAAINGVVKLLIGSGSTVSSNQITMSGANNMHLTWSTDGAGNIGASAGTRPDNVYAKSSMVAGTVVKAGDGSTSAPSFGFSSAGGANFGMYYTSSFLAFSAGNAMAMRLGTAGNLNTSYRNMQVPDGASNAPGLCFNTDYSSGFFYSGTKIQATIQGTASLMEISSTAVAFPKNVELSAGLKVGLSEKSANYTLTTSDYFIGVTNVTGGKTMTLPTAVGNAGRVFIIKDHTGSASATNFIRIAPQAGQTIDGQSNRDIVVPYESVSVVSNGAHWFIM